MSAEGFTLSQGLLCPEEFKEVVQELGSEGHELLAAVQGDATVFCLTESTPHTNQYNPDGSSQSNEMNPSKHSSLLPTYWTNYDIYCHQSQRFQRQNATIIKTEQAEYNSEDQKGFTPWTYNEQGMMMYSQSNQQAVAGAQAVAQIPANVDYAGELDFDILISSHTANRNSWIYSSQLRKVFINMQNVLPVDVKRNPCNIELYLRATLLYSLPQYAQELVERCSTHVDPRMTTNREVEPMTMKHVLRCSNAGSIYLGNTDLKEHLSVITPLGQPQAGMDTVRINYQFMCKNSCPSGMNRRAVDVIFTLEDRAGNVLGRRKLAVRVCSCPKRDKEKEEKEFRDCNHQTPQLGRKRKCSILRPKSQQENHVVHNDTAVYKIPSFEVVGRQTAEVTLRQARDRMFYDISSGAYDEEIEPKARECVDGITKILKSFSLET